jgi:hypothetical protein
MIPVTMTEQEKRDLAVIYGFLVDVWSAQQTKSVAGTAALNREKRKVRNNKTR